MADVPLQNSALKAQCAGVMLHIAQHELALVNLSGTLARLQSECGARGHTPVKVEATHPHASCSTCQKQLPGK